MLVSALLDALLDSLKLLPFLFVTYLFMEWLEHGAAERFKGVITKANGVGGPIVGALLGIVPQCGFSGAAATLYAGRVVGLGTLVAIFLTTSDEMLPIMISEAVAPAVILKVLGIKLIAGILVGLVLNAILAAMGRSHEGFASKHMHDGHSGHDIHQLCEAEGCECVHDECGCDNCHVVEPDHHHDHDHDHRHEHDHGHEHHHHGKANIGHLALAALKHSLQITVFIFIICLFLNLVVEAGFEGLLSSVTETPIVGTLICSVLGFVPNCAVSVALTQLYLDGILGGGAMMGGLLVNSGIGLLVLLRTNNDSRENLRICGVLLLVGVVFGLLVELLGVL